MKEPALVVIGGASLDILHFGGRTVRSAGGAGLYTALAACRAGVAVTMVGPRPEPMPPELAAAAQRLDWRGKTVPPARLPSFEIAHFGDGRSEMRSAAWRAEAELSLDWLPPVVPAGWVYCIPLTDPHRQLQFVRHFKADRSPVACGTYGGAVAEQPEIVRQALATADVFFCNESEAGALFGDLEHARTAAGKLLFVTRSARGVRVVQGTHATDVAAEAVQELDPTGAGDTFCGTALAWLARGAHPVVAARKAVIAAAEMVTEVGPAALLRPPKKRPASGPAVVNAEQVRRIGDLVGALPEVRSFSFTGDEFPPPDHPSTLDFFFAATLQQFGFWTASSGRYRGPMIASLDGRRLKGSDFLWAAFRRWLDDDPEGLAPSRQAALTAEELAHRLRADDGEPPLACELHLQQARAYGRDMAALDWSPTGIMRRAGAEARPLTAFLGQLDRVSGYKEDPMRKKSVLLALILMQRPERFLRRGDAEAVPPAVDYHIQRSCLRMGLVEVRDPELSRRLTDREILDAEAERRIREACGVAMVALQRASGRSMGAVDWFFFQNRQRCPEMTEPECGRCPVDPVCSHRTRLFQPVRRTTFY